MRGLSCNKKGVFPIRVLLLDKQENILREIDVDPYDKQQVKQYLHCDYFDAPRYKIGMNFYRFLVDDNGLPMDDEDADRRTAAITSFGYPILYGNVMCLASHDDGFFSDLTDKDIENLKKHSTTIPNMGLVFIV